MSAAAAEASASAFNGVNSLLIHDSFWLEVIGRVAPMLSTFSFDFKSSNAVVVPSTASAPNNTTI